jgi:hypothetical protein
LNLYFNRLTASPVKTSDGRIFNRLTASPMRNRKKYYGGVELEMVFFQTDGNVP